MAITVNTNIFSLNAQRNVTRSQGDLQTAMQRLSSGLRVNSAKDDAAGMYSIERMTADINGLNQAARNALDGISLAQTAEAALGQIADSLQRIRELAVQASNGTVEDRTGIQSEVDLLSDEILRVADAAAFNGVQLLDGSATAALEFQVGQDGADQISIAAADLDITGITAYGGNGSFDVSTDANAAQAELANLDADIDAVSALRATFGATQNRFEAVVNSVSSFSESLTASRSRMEDADFAAETARMTRAQILQQAGVSVLSQANVQPQMALSLLG